MEAYILELAVATCEPAVIRSQRAKGKARASDAEGTVITMVPRWEHPIYSYQMSGITEINFLFDYNLCNCYRSYRKINMYPNEL